MRKYVNHIISFPLFISPKDRAIKAELAPDASFYFIHSFGILFKLFLWPYLGAKAAVKERDIISPRKEKESKIISFLSRLGRDK